MIGGNGKASNSYEDGIYLLYIIGRKRRHMMMNIPEIKAGLLPF